VRILCDHDVYGLTVLHLRTLGHDVVTAAERGLAQASDLELLAAARDDDRLFVTRDRDFGGLVFVQGGDSGVIYLRISPSVCSAVHAELERVLTLYDEETLRSAFVVVEPGRHRLRRLGSN
jgi:predicted nuclease of predicted toxin-antitoxin system